MSESSKKSADEGWGPPWTILKLLQWTTSFLEDKSESARLDAELLLAHSLGMERMQLYTNFDRPLHAEELDIFRALVKRRASGEPVAYITGERAFWTLDLKTDSRALIPRPDTEVLVEKALELLEAESPGPVIDVGTGTGAIILAIASERPEARLAATDISSEALALAQTNAKDLGFEERIEFFEGDLLSPVDPSFFPARMIVSNPPYVTSSEYEELMVDVKDFEPRRALEAGAAGLDVYERLIPMAFEHLAGGGHLLCEIGPTQAADVQRLYNEAGFEDVGLRHDYADRPRVVFGRRP